MRSLTVRPITTMYLDNDDETIGFSGDNDISQSDVGAVVTKLALVSERLLNALYRAEKSEDKLSGVVDIFPFDLGAFDSAQDELSAF